MKLLVTGDLHQNDKERDQYRHEFMKQLGDLAYKRRPDRIIILGDLTEEKDHHAAWLVNKIVDHMRRLVRSAPITILRGNHDYADISSPFFEFLGKFEGIKWIANPDASHLPGRLFLPHTRNYKADWAKIDLKKFGWIFTHNTFDGAENESGRKMSGIPLSVFHDSLSIAISGDVHVPQRIGPVTYVGAPYLVDFGDRFKPRVLFIDGHKIESIPCTGPQKRLITLGWPAMGDDGSVLKEALKNIKPDDVVKIRVHLRPEQYDHWGTIHDTIRKWGEKQRVRLTVVTPEIEDRRVEPAKRLRKGDVDLMREYVKRQNADERTMTTGNFLRIGAK